MPTGIHTSHLHGSAWQAAHPNRRRATSYIETVDVASREDYKALHAWVNKTYPRTGRCEWCSSRRRRTEYAVAAPGRYTRNRADWLELCRSCHMHFDGTARPAAARALAGRKLKRLILAALIVSAAFVFPAVASADSPICHDGILSDDVGQGCTNEGPASNYAICHDGILSDDVGQGCTNDGPYESLLIGSAGYSHTVYSPPRATYRPSYRPTSGGGYGVPACASESGTNYSTGPANTNPGSGATGRYQIIPSTARAYGCSLATPSGQDQCAARIYAGQGAGAWVGCGG